MNNIYNYLKKYQYNGFLENSFNDVDASILSLVSYLEFDNIKFPKKGMKLGESLSLFLESNNLKEFLQHGFIQKDLIKLTKILKNHFRYKDITIKNYIYKVDDTEQFSAMTFILPDGKKVISFEGTNHELVGWEEDFAMAYKFPSKCQRDAIRYVKRYTNILDKEIIIVGHSKGGHLALISAMYANIFIKKRIKKIYNFDGPGLRQKQINSRQYKSIDNKLIHIVPSYSIVGLLLRHNNNYQVIKSTRKDLYAHSIFTWQIKDDKFVKDKLSILSKNLDKSIIIWLDNHTDKEREKITNDIFTFLRSSGVTTSTDLTKIKTILTLFKNRREIDEETHRVITNFIKFNYDYHKNNLEEIELI